MKTVNYGTCSFLVAAEPTPGIPAHAVEIEGNLIQLDKPNENGWGLAATGGTDFIERSTGVPIRMCNSLDSHECDYNSDNYSNIGYVAKTYSDDGWLKSRAVITNEAAAKQITDGTWMPFSKGSWSVSGLPSGGMSEDGIVDNLLPTSISLILPPNEPAYEGSGFEVVVAALTSDPNHQTKTKEDENMTDKEEGTDPGAAEGNEDPGDPKEKVEDNPGDTGAESTMYDQEAVDKQIATALESQKVEYETQMALMTPNTELETMFAAAKTEAIDATMDQISREKLTTEYIELVSASKVLSAPMMVDGKMDAEKLTAKTEQVKQFSASVIQGMIDESKLMVAALPAGQNPFDAASIESNAPGAGFDYAAVRDEYNTKLGLK